MRIGILKAGAVADDLAPRYGDYGHMFRRLLADPACRAPGAPAPEFLDVDAEGGALPPVEACDSYVITGSRHSVYDDLPWIAPLVEFLRRARELRRPLVGICFGHQLLAHFFGGETRRAEAGWCVGVHSAQVITPTHWMLPGAASISLVASHRDQVVRPPPDARVFARGTRCPIAGFVMDGVLTFQGHPEFSRSYAEALLETREAVLGADLFGEGKASLERSTDALLVGRWMMNFMTASAAAVTAQTVFTAAGAPAPAGPEG